MSFPDSPPKWVDELVRTLGADMGLEGLSFGDDGVFELGIHGTEIAVFYVPPSSASGGALLVKSALDLPRHMPASILGLLLATNLSTFQVGKGMVACDLDFGFWVWTDRIDLAGLTAPAFRARLEQCANAARDWASLVPDLVARAAETETDPTPDTDADATNILFRL